MNQSLESTRVEKMFYGLTWWMRAGLYGHMICKNTVSILLRILALICGFALFWLIPWFVYTFLFLAVYILGLKHAQTLNQNDLEGADSLHQTLTAGFFIWGWFIAFGLSLLVY